MTYIAYAAGAIFTLFGLALLFNIFKLPSDASAQKVRVMMGVVLSVYGLYRIVSTIIKERRKDEEL